MSQPLINYISWTRVLPQLGAAAVLILLAVTGIAVTRMRNLFAAVMLAGIYSLVSAGLFVVMDAVDVAFTEAAVGAGISTVLMLGTLALVGHEERRPQRRPVLPIFVVLVTVVAPPRSGWTTAPGVTETSSREKQELEES